MMTRCYNKKRAQYHDYGGRGITVCERWRSFFNFLSDMGERPEGKTLDRFPNNDGNYEPGNCRWATRKEQNRNSNHNRLITYDGATMTLSEWAERHHISISILIYRLKRMPFGELALRPTKPEGRETSLARISAQQGRRAREHRPDEAAQSARKAREDPPGDPYEEMLLRERGQ